MYSTCAGSNVILIQRDGYCLFCVASCCMCNTDDKHYEITLNTVNNVSKSEIIIKNFIVDLSMANIDEDYKNLLSRNGKHGGSMKLTCISRLFSNYLFRVQYETSINTVDCRIRNIVYHLLFNYAAGHFEVHELLRITKYFLN